MDSSLNPFDVVTVVCPYCGESVELGLEADIDGEMVVDCEICCRPWQVVCRRDGKGRRSFQIERME